ncbi:CGNR zinc finger domain-containing protein [Paenibacillus methanolicus]|uniref:Putative RNA-binding Zn ribbon-like protein n=1 Tax=Paenibacillus methanolicus TaxID=582686 RepID=A0A5S5C7K8_9BACL|nr:ABATE domain-containing protein [Paenibacillus methanolicus]TYP75401.1 putative RNA-binding Zn ribbon-like protein [Paenibacillus methanolicus]
MPKIIPPTFLFIGNEPMLDFTNTHIMAGGQPLDLLTDYDALWEWMGRAGLLTEEAEAAASTWGEAAKERLHGAAVELRRHLLAVVKSLLEGKPVNETHLAPINGLLDHQAFATRLYQENGMFREERRRLVRGPLDLLAPIAESAAKFLSRNEPHLLRKCENPECVLHFYDNSKNGMRRWCSPKTCGNRMKVTAYLERRRAQSQSISES